MSSQNRLEIETCTQPEAIKLIPACSNCAAAGLWSVSLSGVILTGLCQSHVLAWPPALILALMIASIVPLRHFELHRALSKHRHPQPRPYDLPAYQALDRMEGYVRWLKRQGVAHQLSRSEDDEMCRVGSVEALLLLGPKHCRQPMKFVAFARSDDLQQCDLRLAYYGRVPLVIDSLTEFIARHNEEIFASFQREKGFLVEDAPPYAAPSTHHEMRVRACVSNLPRRVKLLLLRHGCVIYPVSRITDMFSHLKTARPTGYEQGHTYEHCAAVYNSQKRMIVIAEQVKKEGEWIDAGDDYIFQSVEHEVGHALDHALGLGNTYFSHTDTFARAYESDKNALPPNEVSRLQYYLQEGVDGREETFADIFNSVSVPWHDADHIEKHFPLCTEVIRRRLLEVEVELAPHRKFDPQESRMLIARARRAMDM